MVARCLASICGIFFLGTWLSAQTAPASTVKIRFSDHKKQPSGGQFMFRKTDGTYLPPGTSGGEVSDSLVIPIPTEEPVDGIKVRVWRAGCAMKLFDIALAGGDLEAQFFCEPETTVAFRGRIAGPVQPTEISAQYSGECMRGRADEREMRCIFPIFVATANLEVDGSFSIELPDFKADPIVASDQSAAFKFVISTENGGWRIVKSEESDNPLIPVASSYSDDVTFVLAK
jgi:hypothetical protein